MLDSVMSLVAPALRAATADDASRAFLAAMERRGATYLQTRVYRRPQAPLTSASHWAAGGFVTRIAVPGWVDSSAFHYVCFEQNPLLRPIREGLTRYRFSDFAPRRDRAFGAYWDALSEARITDALCATAYASEGRLASLHLGFGAEDFSEEEARTLQVAGLALVEKLLTFGLVPPLGEKRADRLTRRESDTIAFVAEGKTDWEIATILGIAESTARFHVDNARRKLGATNRAHEVARFLATNGLS